GQPLARCRSLKILTEKYLAILPICFSCEHFMLFELAACAAGSPHQAPTLIGCWLLKIQLLAAGQARRIAVEAFCSSAAEKRDYAAFKACRQPPFVRAGDVRAAGADITAHDFFKQCSSVLITLRHTYFIIDA
ncbi:hypothetical protein, partial [Noviherbaspirillum aerium]|uniref:hypothetical protein n=1 Tax=Noviherbaspirillum aerium TaxID=2588497 RepID=UPI001CEF6B09